MSAQNRSSPSAAGAKLVVEMRQPDEPQFAGGVELAQEVRERDRVRPPDTAARTRVRQRPARMVVRTRSNCGLHGSVAGA